MSGSLEGAFWKTPMGISLKDLSDSLMRPFMPVVILVNDYVVTTVKTRDNELRGAWIHTPYGLFNYDWDKTIQVLKDAGFNAVFVNLCWGYSADYPSQVLPVHPDVAKIGNHLQRCLDACKKHGIQLHVWRVCWNMGHRASKEDIKKMQEAKYVQMTYDGKTSLFLAPHIKENQDREVRAFVEIVKNYDVAGVHLDYIRYPDKSCDFSPSARASFEAFAKKKVENWPADCGEKGKYRAEYEEWRRRNIDALVARVYKEVKAAKPSAIVSAAVYGGWKNARVAVAQDAQKWIDNHWVDFVVPMDYTDDMKYFDELVVQNVTDTANKVPLYIGVGNYLHPLTLTTCLQIDHVRQLGADGFVCFDLKKTQAHKFPDFVLGPTRTPASGVQPHESRRAMFDVCAFSTKYLGGAILSGDSIKVVIRMADGTSLPPNTTVRLMKDGYLLEKQVPIALDKVGNQTVCRLSLVVAGLYRLELGDGAGFVCRSQNIQVMAAKDAKEYMEKNGTKPFFFK